VTILNPSLNKRSLMNKNVSYPRLKYFVSYILAMAAAFLTFRSFYMFEGNANFGIQTVILNFVIIILLWFLSFIHTDFIRRNIVLVLVFPLAGLQIANLMLLMTSPGASLFGYIGFIVTSSMLIFASYTARNYERQL
jgi:hypothetical protein